MRRRWLLLVLFVCAGAGAVVGVAALLGAFSLEPRWVRELTWNEDEGAGPSKRRTIKLPPPDQPLWTKDVSGTYYGLKDRDFVRTYWATRALGEPKPVSGKQGLWRVEPFVLAGLPWDIEPLPDQMEETRILDRVMKLLRKAKIFSAANPVVLSFPLHRDDPSTWEGDDREPGVGIPVPPGTRVESPLIAVPFAGRDVILGEPQPRVFGSVGDWTPLVERARAMGREPDFPVMIRYSGWRSPKGPRLMYQLILPLKPLEPEEPREAGSPPEHDAGVESPD